MVNWSLSPAVVGWGGQYDPANNPTLIVPFSYGGVPFSGGVHRLAVAPFRALLDRLVPLMPGGLLSPGCWGYSGSSLTSGGSRSFHQYAIAIDVNAPYNAMRDSRYARTPSPYLVPEAASQIAHDLGMKWGGDWSSPYDPMHFEIHLSPAECEQFVYRPSLGQDPLGEGTPLITGDEFDMATLDDLTNRIVAALRSEGVSGAGDIERATAARVRDAMQGCTAALRSEGVSGAADAGLLAATLVPAIIAALPKGSTNLTADDIEAATSKAIKSAFGKASL